MVESRKFQDQSCLSRDSNSSFLLFVLRFFVAVVVTIAFVCVCVFAVLLVFVVFRCLAVLCCLLLLLPRFWLFFLVALLLRFVSCFVLCSPWLFRFQFPSLLTSLHKRDIVDPGEGRDA
eukprot:TRINITY_DN2551_c0_g2_i2.p1 TRINITY_DN2551_c0_g2~~TRINITY_DN2551_c0_g2_i2.p1  ORF type:complete len:119 (+),score=1.48 TRINITY_DN2551_c0_g2_i2:223-579(+)